MVSFNGSTRNIHAKRNRASHSSLSGKRFEATEDRSMTDQRVLFSRTPRSCIRNRSQENLLERTKIVLALPSYNRQRLSGIRRGWCPSQLKQELKRVARSDSGVAHRLSLSARVVSALYGQVKAKRQGRKRLWRMRNPRFARGRGERRRRFPAGGIKAAP